MYGRDHAESEVGDALRGIMTGFIERLCGYINASTDSESQPVRQLEPNRVTRISWSRTGDPASAGVQPGV